MSFPSTIVLKNAVPASENFLRIVGDLSKVTYMKEGSTLSLPVELVIGHQMSKSPTGVDRHLGKTSVVVADTSEKLVQGGFSCTLTVPRTGISRSHINDMIARQIEFWGNSSNVDMMLLGML